MVLMFLVAAQRGHKNLLLTHVGRCLTGVQTRPVPYLNHARKPHARGKVDPLAGARSHPRGSREAIIPWWAFGPVFRFLVNSTPNFVVLQKDTDLKKKRFNVS